MENHQPYDSLKAKLILQQKFKGKRSLYAYLPQRFK